jgi:glycosyltransferase involved in cell wall biosynthesis
MTASVTHLVLVPTYNAGPRLLSTVQAALARWQPVWVVVDGSTDGSEVPVVELAKTRPALRVLLHSGNRGKGAAVLTGVAAALAAGFTHALVMDSDGQHPVDSIPEFMRASEEDPSAAILGRPVFGPEAPAVRLHGRKVSAGLVRFEIGGGGIDDPLFGFRVYPLAPLRRVMERTRFARHFDFDPEAAVRLFWDGVPTRNLPAPCRYLAPSDGGVSHFHYVRDNLRMVGLHTRLLTELVLWRWFALRRLRKNTLRQPSR